VGDGLFVRYIFGFSLDASTHILSALNPAMILTKTGLILIISANEAGRIMKAKMHCDSPQGVFWGREATAVSHRCHGGAI